MDKRKCINCESTTTTISRGYPEWRNVSNYVFCLKCYHHIFKTKTGKIRRNIPIPMADRRCYKCGSVNTGTITKNNKKYPYWRNFNEQCWCDRCYALYIQYPKTTRIRITYKNKHIYLKEKVKTGKCQLCKKSIGDKYIDYSKNEKIISRTDTHHIHYHDDDPLLDTIELCISCHTKVTWIERKGGKPLLPSNS